MKTCPVCDTPFPEQLKTCPTDGAVLIESRELAPGHIVRGKYRIVRKLGQGGMGIVYLAEHLMLGGQMALKFLASELTRNPQFVKRFRNEAKAAYQLRHPNIVEVVDLDQEEDGSLFIAMEYVAGPSLRSALREAKGPLPVERALRIARGIATGLAAAHARGAVHRDIKPENILLAIQPDGSEQVKVLDFGIAVMTEGITNLSRTHGLLLTPEFAAPEQWRGTPASELDGRTDLYALGGILYEMLAGQTPFRAVNPEGWMFQHLQGVPEPLALLRPDLDREYPGLNPLVMSLLARECAQRPPSATAVLEALSFRPAPRSYAPPPAPAPTQAPVAPPQPQPSRSIPQPPSPTSSSATSHPAASATSSSAPNQLTQPMPGPRWGLWAGLGAGLAMVIVLGFWFGAKLLRPVPVAAVPVLTPAGGTYPAPQTVAISDSTPQATIHYTLDRSAPTASSPVYTHPLDSLPSGTVVVRAMATADGFQPSSDTTGIYNWTPTPSLYDQAKSAYDAKQYSQARALFGQACDAGDLSGCNYLGYLYAQGMGGAPDAGKATGVYLKACTAGNLSSCASLGSLYQDAGNSSEARQYFQKACDGGLQDGCAFLRGVK